MNNIVYLKEPGILYDMLFALKLRFNGERAYIPLRMSTLTQEEDERFYNKIINRLSNVSDNLLPLFYYDSENDVKTAMMSYIYEHIDLTSDNLIEGFYESLRDVERLKRTVYRNYISEDCPATFDSSAACDIRKTILSSALPDNFKIYLYDFLLFAEDYIEDIITSFRKVEKVCREYHEKYEKEIPKYVEKFGEEQIKQLGECHAKDISQHKKIYLTYCAIFVCAKMYCDYDSVWVSIFGVKAFQTLLQAEDEKSINLFELGKILFDKQRLKILDMLTQEDMYCAQIAHKLELQSNSTLYHLVMMEKEGLIASIKKPNYNRRVYYKINRNYINSIKKFLDIKFTGEKNNDNC